MYFWKPKLELRCRVVRSDAGTFSCPPSNILTLAIFLFGHFAVFFVTLATLAPFFGCFWPLLAHPSHFDSFFLAIFGHFGHCWLLLSKRSQPQQMAVKKVPKVAKSVQNHQKQPKMGQNSPKICRGPQSCYRVMQCNAGGKRVSDHGGFPPTHPHPPTFPRIHTCAHACTHPLTHTHTPARKCARTQAWSHITFYILYHHLIKMLKPLPI